MTSLFDPEQSHALVARLRALQPEQQRLWGKMTPAQACAHSQFPLKIALGDVTWPRT
jgi:hypothetical protein